MAFGVDEQCMLLAFIAYGEEVDSRAAVDIVPGEFYDGPYRKVHTKFHSYLTRFRSKLSTHVPDIIKDLVDAHSDIQSDLVDIFSSLDSYWKQGLNRDFVFQKARIYVEQRRWLSFLAKAAPLVNGPGDEEKLAKIQDLYKTTVTAVHSNVEIGLNLKDVERVNSALAHRPHDAFYTGIQTLDERGICPTRKQLFTLIAPSGSGKSTGLLHFATTPWWHGGPNGERINVLYIDLEQDVGDEVQRIFKSRGLYTEDVKKAGKEIVQVSFELDKMGRADPTTKTQKKLRLTSDKAKRDAIHEKIAQKGEFFICSKPAHWLTLSRTEALLDAIASQYHVQIDLLAVDYLGLMQEFPGSEDSIDKNSLGLRNLARQRNLAAMTAQQTNRDGDKALASGQLLTAAHIEGSKRLVNNTDKLLIFNQTEAEKRENLARLLAAKGRQQEAGFLTVISQNPAASRFAVSSGLSSMLWEKTLKDK
jgi:hypothetical protein